MSGRSNTAMVAEIWASFRPRLSATPTTCYENNMGNLGRERQSLLLDLLVVLPFGPEECIISADSNEPDFEDGMIRAAAELNDVDFILTRDVKAFNHSTVRSITCETYLEIIASEDREAITTLRESVINS